MKASFADLTVEQAGFLHVMAQIEEEVSQDPWDLESIRTHFSSPENFVVGAFLEDLLVGFITYQVVLGSSINIFQIAVARAAQRQGIARGLITAVKTLPDIVEIFLEVRPTNFAACELYRTEGFKHVGRRRTFYRDGADAITMRWAKDL